MKTKGGSQEKIQSVADVLSCVFSVVIHKVLFIATESVEIDYNMERELNDDFS